MRLGLRQIRGPARHILEAGFIGFIMGISVIGDLTR
jgi:hypothetical protein